MEEELEMGEILDDLQERLAVARTKALMGERQEALGLLQLASLEYTRFKDVLAAYPGAHALEHALRQTTASLCVEQDHAEAQATAIERRLRPRARSRKVA